MPRLLPASLLLLCLILALSPARAAEPVEPDPLWKDKIEPLLKKHCFRCHGGEKQKGGLDVRSLAAMIVGGTDGSVVIPGRPSESPLLQRIQSDGDDRMPPEKDQKLSADETVLLTQWIASLTVPREDAASRDLEWAYDAPTLIEQARRIQWSPPSDLSPPQVIDHLIQATWQKHGVKGSGPCDDATFVRRVHLDLVGRIPTAAEAAEFVQSSASDKRAALVDRLLASPEYAGHLAEVFDFVLLAHKGRDVAAQRRAGGWFAYLERSFAANRPWNVMVKEFIVARATTAEAKGAEWFLYEQKNNHSQMAEAVAPLAFGVKIDCAQCHNHPLAHEIKQQDYWGLVAAFNRTTNVETNAGPALSESAVGGFLNFTNLKKESQPALIRLLNGKVVNEAWPAEGAKEDDNDANYHVPPDRKSRRPRQAAVPKFSRRQAAADAIVTDNPLLAQAFVNRIWALLLGRGLVQPVDEIDSRYPASHPELLAWLARDFESSGYDTKRLIRNIVLSQTYQLRSHAGSAAPPAPELFAASLEKPLTAEVFYRSLLTATNNPSDETDELKHALIKAFPAPFALEYNATLQQSALLTNSPLVDRLLQPGGTNLTARLSTLTTPEERVRAAFVSILGRAPDDEELRQSVAYLAARPARAEIAARHLTWALLTSPEFLLNH